MSFDLGDDDNGNEHPCIVNIKLTGKVVTEVKTNGDILTTKKLQLHPNEHIVATNVASNGYDFTEHVQFCIFSDLKI